MEAAVSRQKTLVHDALLGFILAETISLAFALATNSAHPGMALFGILYALIFGFIQGTIVGIFHPIALLWPAYNIFALLIGAMLAAVLLNIDRRFIRVLGFVGFFIAYLMTFVWVVARFLPSQVFTLTSPKPW